MPNNADDGQELELLLEQLLPQSKSIGFLGEIPCPVKLAFREAYDAYCAAHPGEFTSYIPTTCGLENTEAGRSILRELVNGPEADLPEMVLSFGLRDFFMEPILHRVLNSERCHTPVPFKEAEPYEKLGLQDPEGIFTVFSSLPMVLVADLRLLGDLPMPRQWGDLLDPIYKGRLCFPPGEEDSMEALPLIHFHRNFGDEGLRMLAANVAEFTCGSKVAMKVGTGKSTCAISAVTWFFANAAVKNGGVRLILPEDGAFLNPVYLASVRRPSPGIEKLRSFLLSDEMAAVWDRNFYPAVSSSIRSALPPRMTLQWMGWDYIRSHSIREYIRELQRTFASYWREAH